MNYTLKISFDATGLTNILKAGQYVTIVNPPIGPASPPVAWISFSPLAANTVTWDSSFAVYSFSPPVPPIVPPMGPMTARLGHTYTVGAYGYTASAGGPADAVTIVNGVAHAMAVGLCVSFSVNGGLSYLAAVDVVTLQPNEEGAFAPGNIVSIFLTGSMKSGTVLSEVPASALSVDISDHPVASVTYDDASGTFQLT